MSVELPEIEGLSEDQVHTLVSCRAFRQYVGMLEGYRAGKCPFCDPLDPEKNKVINQVGRWRMWVNPFPTKHSKLHLVMAPCEHMDRHSLITSMDFANMGGLFMWAQQEFGFTGGGFVMRFGSPKHGSGTVLHLHANIIIPDLSGPVQVPLAKGPEQIAEKVARMRVFEKLRLGANVEALNDDERKLVEGRL
jgi:diadenosine tetraphosphate (Ap4A) HIT family hydrolase